MKVVLGSGAGPSTNSVARARTLRKRGIMPSLLVQGGSILGTEDEEDAAVAEIFTSVDPLTQDRHQPYR